MLFCSGWAFSPFKSDNKTDAAEIQRILSGIGFMRQKIRKQFTPP